MHLAGTHKPHLVMSTHRCLVAVTPHKPAADGVVYQDENNRGKLIEGRLAHLKLLGHKVEVQELEGDPNLPVSGQDGPHVLLQLGHHLMPLSLRSANHLPHPSNPVVKRHVEKR